MSAFSTFFRKPYYAWRGLRYIVRRESSFRFQLVVAAAVVAGSLALKLSALEWAVLSLAVGAVLVVEVVNTVLERLLDVVEPRFSSHVALLKDLLAAAALIVASAAVVAVVALAFSNFR